MVLELFKRIRLNTGYYNRVKQLQAQGSPTYESIKGVLAATTTYWYQPSQENPACRAYEPLDFIEIINNSAQAITVYINSITNLQRVPAYMIKPISKTAVRQYGIRNEGAVDTVAGDVIVHYKRMAPDIQVVQSANLQR